MWMFRDRVWDPLRGGFEVPRSGIPRCRAGLEEDNKLLGGVYFGDELEGLWLWLGSTYQIRFNVALMKSMLEFQGKLGRMVQYSARRTER